MWALILGLAVWSMGLRAAGPVLLDIEKLPPSALKVLAYIAPAVLSALIVNGIFGAQRALVVDERVAGFLAAIAAAWLRLPPLAIIVIAAAATAVARQLT